MKDELTFEMQLLEIHHYPFLMDELQDNFRLLIKKFHPDIYKEKDAHEKTTQLIKAYKKLIGYASNYDNSKVIKDDEIEDIFRFYETCKVCNGTGTRIYKHTVLKYECPKCKDSGIILVKCNRCDSGKFTLKSGRIVECLTCKGTGIYKMNCNHRINFEDLLFNRYGNNYTVKEEIIKCKNCGGKGKVEFVPVNPVIRKGAVL
jgi:DnaJ-class molecular chaperone